MQELCVRRVLFPRLDSYGDILLTAGLVSELSRFWPDAEFHMLVRRPYLDVGQIYPQRVTWHGVGIDPYSTAPRELDANDDIGDILNAEWDYCISTCFNRTWLEDAIIAELTGRGVRTVQLGKGGEHASAAGCLSTVFVREYSHELEKYATLSCHITGKAEIPPPRIRLDPSVRAQAAVFCADAALEIGSFLVCVPGGGVRRKLWRPERYAECLAAIECNHNLRAVVAGSLADGETVNEVARLAHRFGASPAVWIGKEGQIPFIAALLADSRMYLGNDTGPMHLALAAGIPVVAIFGGGHWPRFAIWEAGVACAAELPCYGCDWRCMFDSALCIQSVGVGQVMEGVERVLNGTGVDRILDVRPHPALSHHQIRAASSNFRQLSTDAMLLRLQYEKTMHSLVTLQEQANGAPQTRYPSVRNATQDTIEALQQQLAEAGEAIEKYRGELADRAAAQEELERQAAAARAERDALASFCDSTRNDPFSWFLGSSLKPAAPFEFENPAQPGAVSVVIPAYNSALFLEQAIESVWQQDVRDHPVEIFVIDDGSKDSSLDIAKTMQVRSPVPMFVLRHPEGVNRGVSATRNLGIRHSTGEFIALLDSDDSWLPNRLSVQLAYLKANPEVCCVCSYGYNKDLEGNDVTGWSGSTIAGDYRNCPGPRFRSPYTFEQLLEGDPIVNSTLLIRRSAIETCGAYPDVMAHQAEDWFLLAKLALVSPIQLIPTPLIRYLIHPDSYTTQYVNRGLGQGARLEFLHYLLHWMVCQPALRPKAEWVFRRFYPALAAAPYRAYRLLEQYYLKHNRTTAAIDAFESHLCGVYEELRTLQHYRDVIEGQLNVLRRIPGLVRLYHFGRRLTGAE